MKNQGCEWLEKFPKRYLHAVRNVQNEKSWVKLGTEIHNKIEELLKKHPNGELVIIGDQVSIRSEKL